MNARISQLSVLGAKSKKVPTKERAGPPLIKCIIWDLDNTLWEGILSEDATVTVRSDIVALIRRLDTVGVLHSIASRNDAEHAFRKLRDLQIEDMFLVPQIGWGSKSEAIEQIAQCLKLSADTFLFIDDDPFERDEVKARFPAIRCLPPLDLFDDSQVRSLFPTDATEEARGRRRMYLADSERQRNEGAFRGEHSDFLASLAMKCIIRRASPSDLERISELLIRTNQLNATGVIYSREQLLSFISDLRRRVLIIGFEDRYGSYGKIGVLVITSDHTGWRITMTLVSCRVLSRGVGSFLLAYVQKCALRTGRPLFADYISTGRNRMMMIALRMAGFSSARQEGDVEILEWDRRTFASGSEFIELDAPRGLLEF